MKLTQITESIPDGKEKMSPTVDWMKKMYGVFNKKYFQGKLPSTSKVRFYVKEALSGSKWLGEQGFDEPYQYYVKSRVILYHGERPAKSLEELKPTIGLSSSYLFTPEEMENTLIHEMNHIYTYIMTGLKEPKQAHGKEFRAHAKEIENWSGGTVQITRFADSHGGEYEMTAAAKDKAQKKLDAKRQGAGLIYFELDLSESDSKYFKEKCNFIVVKKAKKDFVLKKMQDNKYCKITSLEYYENGADVFFEKHGDFTVCSSFRYWYVKDYPEEIRTARKTKPVNTII